MRDRNHTNERLNDIILNNAPASDYKGLTIESNGVTVELFKGKPVIVLPMGKRKFTFGVRKAELILMYLEQIQDFVKGNGTILEDELVSEVPF